MEIGFLGFRESCQLELAAKCLITLRHVAPSTRWRFGKVYIDLDDSKEIAEEIERRTVQVLEPGDNMLCLSAVPESNDTYTMVQFTIYNPRTSSSVRIDVNEGATLSDRVARCYELMMCLIPVWKPECAYIKDFEQMKLQCPHLKGVFPSGYAIYRKQSLIPRQHFENSEVFEVMRCETGSCFRFREQVINSGNITCEHFQQLIDMAGGIDDRFTVLV
jgi:hypothetical protein